MNALKAAGPSDSSESIVISFQQKWLDPLRHQQISVVFRKRGPKKIIPRFIYVYVGSPHCLLLGRLPVTHYETLKTNAASRQAAKAGLSVDELAAYLKGYSDVFTFTVGPLQQVTRATDLKQLVERFGFSPPQSFFVLSLEGKQRLDDMAGLR